MVRGVFQQRVLVGGDVVQADALHVIDGRTQAHGIGNIARASLELGRMDAARALLQAVMREGSGRHAAEAAEILARMG